MILQLTAASTARAAVGVPTMAVVQVVVVIVVVVLILVVLIVVVSVVGVIAAASHVKGGADNKLLIAGGIQAGG